jgi:hypothetical protein
MLYFDRMHEEHFGTIKQQVWASLHFFLHIMLVLVLQGVSYLIMWVVALVRMDRVGEKFRAVEGLSVNKAYANGTLFANALSQKIDTYLWNTIPKGVDASKALETWNSSLVVLAQSYDNVQKDGQNMTAAEMITTSLNNAESMAIQTLFDSLSISVPKTAKKIDEGPKRVYFDKVALLQRYETRFELVFDYVFLSVCQLFLYSSLRHSTNKRCRLVSPLPSWPSSPSSRYHPESVIYLSTCVSSSWLYSALLSASSALSTQTSRTRSTTWRVTGCYRRSASSSSSVWW